jgi:hypothetical protein
MTGRQELHAAGGAAEERHAELVLQALDLPAQRRLRDVQTTCGAPDVSLFGDRHEAPELVETHEASIPRAARPGAIPKGYWSRAERLGNMNR